MKAKVESGNRIVKCSEHAEGKPCIRVIADGKCVKERCNLFPKVLNLLPKLKKLHEAEARGVIPTTIWVFSKKGNKQTEKRKEKAQKWLTELLPKIEQNLGEKTT